MRILFFFLLLLSVRVSGQSEFPAELEDPNYIGLNKEEPHAYFVPQMTKEDALHRQDEDSPWYMSLDGEWKFKWVANPSERPTDFIKHSHPFIPDL